jgi:DNA mismatch repair protein MutL
MGNIKLLDKSIVNKISAGEVIERPSSVVKELIENAIDAGADSIIVEIKNAGKSMIKISDNGCGMDEEDARISFKSHTTSKLINENDLFNIKTLGFRGEALATIAEVSSLEIKTKKKEKDIGIKINVKGGEVISEEKIGMPAGTTLIIKDLFYNTPARKKHLKSDNLEFSHITDIVTRYALSNKGLSIKLFHNDKRVISSAKTTNYINKIVDIYGKDVAKHMLEVNYKNDLMQIQGYIAKPSINRKDKFYQTLFVNSRYVKNNIVCDAVKDAYSTMLFLRQQPIFILFLEIDFSKTDVNVHPSKDIIRIENEDLIYDVVKEAVEKTTKNNSLIPDVEIAISSSNRKPVQTYNLVKDKQKTLEVLSINRKINETENFTGYQKLIKRNGIQSIENESDSDINQLKIRNKDVVFSKQNISSSKSSLDKEAVKYRIGPVNILGQINRLYIVCESATGLMLIDQHAAQERVLFEQYLFEIESKNVKKQRLLRPKILDLTQTEKSLLADNIELFEQLGFIIQEHAGGSYILTEIPQLFRTESKNIINIILEDLLKTKQRIGQITKNVIAQKACKSAIKAGDELQKNQMYKLIEDLEKCEKPFSCPHGRPTIINITLSELEKKFKRVK